MSKFLIGDIVAFQTHPFTSLTNDIIVSGEYQMIPPVMVIVEVIPDSIVKSPRDGQRKYKCLWFSTKQSSFIENYFSESDLKSVFTINMKESNELKVDTLVTLKTMQIELGKKRSFLSTEADHTIQKNTSSISGLLTFVPPVMSVLEILPFNSDSDKKTSPDLKRQKIYPAEMAKCKWFNPTLEKFSETLVPVDALLAIPKLETDLLKVIENAISNSLYLVINKIIVRPQQLSNRSGFYYVTVFNYIEWQTQTLPIGEFGQKIRVKSEYTKNHAPVFKARGKEGKKKLKMSVSIEDMLREAMARNNRNYVWIRYRDQFGSFTQRTLSKYEFIEGENYFEESSGTVKYLKAYCHLRKAERNFLLANIVEATELDLHY